MLHVPAYRLAFSLHEPGGLLQAEPCLPDAILKISLRAYRIPDQVLSADSYLECFLSDLRALYHERWFDRMVAHEPLQVFFILTNMATLVVRFFFFLWLARSLPFRLRMRIGLT